MNLWCLAWLCTAKKFFRVWKFRTLFASKIKRMQQGTKCNLLGKTNTRFRILVKSLPPTPPYHAGSTGVTEGITLLRDVSLLWWHIPDVFCLSAEKLRKNESFVCDEKNYGKTTEKLRKETTEKLRKKSAIHIVLVIFTGEDEPLLHGFNHLWLAPGHETGRRWVFVEIVPGLRSNDEIRAIDVMFEE